VINVNSIEDDVAIINPENVEIPLLVYIAREKRPSHPHHFKAGALNVLVRYKHYSRGYNLSDLIETIRRSNVVFILVWFLQLRVSGTMSNSPYILVLDCDMYCNDSSSARQAMCFYVDPRTPSSLGWVQYPQKFHNISEIDIYDGQLAKTWTVS